MDSRDTIYIDGAWVPSTSKSSIDVVNPATEEVIGRIPEGTAEDVDRAVAAARKAFETWSTTSIDERAKYLERLQEGLVARQEQIALTIASEMGAPLKIAQMIQAGLPVTVMGSYAQLVRDFDFEETIGNSLVVREPIGVVGAITPWNYPLHQVVNKVAPAIAAGCTIVLKPSEVAPLCAYALAEIIDEVGLPPGVFNLVTGTGPVVGEAIAAHPNVDLVHFTGSTRAGKRVSELAAQTVKRVALELGGKSANVILDDADLPLAVKVGVSNVMVNSGQTCTAWTRMLVPRDRQAEAVQIASELAPAFAPSDPMSEGSRMGPLVSATQRDRVRGYIEKGIAEGATLVTGGADAPADLPTGYYVSPTVFADVTTDMTIAQEEIFGPVLAIIPYDDEADALRIANDSVYGLAGGVWSGDPERAKAFARKMRTGQVDINGGRFNPLAPFGGYKQSGSGRELGRYGLEEFLEVKSLQLLSAMRVYLGTDHAGFELKERLVVWLNENGHEPVDCGALTYDADDDYPAYCAEAARRAVADPGSLAVVLGGSGNGEAMAANKVPGARAALCWTLEVARLAREHNDANVCSLGARLVDEPTALDIVRVFLGTPFSHDPRHVRRIGQLAELD